MRKTYLLSFASASAKGLYRQQVRFRIQICWQIHIRCRTIVTPHCGPEQPQITLFPPLAVSAWGARAVFEDSRLIHKETVTHGGCELKLFDHFAPQRVR
jgi:hypothetical protein